MNNLRFVVVPVASFLFLAGCDHSKDDAAARLRGGFPVTIFEANGEDGSPIIVGSGSIHLRQHDNAVYQIDMNHAYVNLKNHTAIEAGFGYCPNKAVGGVAIPGPIKAGDCNFGNPQSSNASEKPQPLDLTNQAPWKMELYSDAGMTNRVATLSTIDQSGLVLFQTEKPTQSLAVEDDENSGQGDGEGVVECGLKADPHAGDCNIALAAAKITYKDGSPHPLLCPQNLPGACNKIKIRYCQNPGSASCRNSLP